MAGLGLGLGLGIVYISITAGFGVGGSGFVYIHVRTSEGGTICGGALCVYIYITSSEFFLLAIIIILFFFFFFFFFIFSSSANSTPSMLDRSPRSTQSIKQLVRFRFQTQIQTPTQGAMHQNINTNKYTTNTYPNPAGAQFNRPNLPSPPLFVQNGKESWPRCHYLSGGRRKKRNAWRHDAGRFKKLSFRYGGARKIVSSKTGQIAWAGATG